MQRSSAVAQFTLSVCGED